MSMRTWTEDGYGYPLFNVYNLDQIKKFIIDNDLRKYTVEELLAIKSADDEFELGYCIDDPVPWKVADIINRLEGITVIKGYQDDGDTDQEAMIGIEPCYSWTMNENDPKTKEEADVLLNKYAEILGITVKPDYFIAEYFG